MEGRDAYRAWEEAYRRCAAEGTELLWPCETLVRLLRGPYVPFLPRSLRGLRLLDVGFGNANNFPFYRTLGLRVSGVEVDPGICDLVRGRMAATGMEADLRVGSNREIPFDDGAFDLVVSWNVLHYEGSAGRVGEGLAAYRRVLAPGGVLILSTVGPDHKILDGAETLGEGRFRIARADDFRRGEVFYCFPEEKGFDQALSRAGFAEVRTGRTTDRILTATLDHWIIAARA